MILITIIFWIQRFALQNILNEKLYEVYNKGDDNNDNNNDNN